MAVLRQQAHDAARPQARAQAVDERSKAGFTIRLVECGLLRWARFRNYHIEPGEIETEAGIDRIGERCQPLDEQRAHLTRVSDRPRRSSRDANDLAVGAVQLEL